MLGGVDAVASRRCCRLLCRMAASMEGQTRRDAKAVMRVLMPSVPGESDAWRGAPAGEPDAGTATPQHLARARAAGRQLKALMPLHAGPVIDFALNSPFARSSVPEHVMQASKDKDMRADTASASFTCRRMVRGGAWLLSSVDVHKKVALVATQGIHGCGRATHSLALCITLHGPLPPSACRILASSGRSA